MAAVAAQAGPSRPKKTGNEPISVEPNEDVDDPRPAASSAGLVTKPGETEEGDEDEERMDLKAIESFAK